MNSITQDMRFRQSLMNYAKKYGVSRASRKYNKSRSYIYFWLKRWDGSVESLAVKSRRPHHHHTPRHNGKVERSHREDHNKFYLCHRFYSCDDLNVQLAARLSRTNNRPMRPLKWFSPIEFLNNSVQYD